MKSVLIMLFFCLCSVSGATGVTLHASLLEPRGAVFTAAEVNLQPPYEPSIGVKKLLIHLPITRKIAVTGQAESAPVSRIVVGLSIDSARPTQKLNSLLEWKHAGPFVHP